MKFIETFLKQVTKYNGQNVHLEITQIDESNHPFGSMGARMMGEAQIERINKAMKEYKSGNTIIKLDAYMEIVIKSGVEKLMFLNDEFDCNCIEIFRPDPPMIMMNADMSLWWSYHQLTDNENSQLIILKDKYTIYPKSIKGECHPIRDIKVNSISHCLV